jgi:hypothetical protein
MKNKYLASLAKYSSPLISRIENRKIEKLGFTNNNIHPVFIIGAPRTGSSILYQILSNEYDLLYVNNLIDYFHRNIFFGFWLSNKIYKNYPHNNFNSFYGQTYKYGLKAPSECGGFWYRWVPKNKIYIELNEINSEDIKKLHNNIYSIINRYKKFLLFKNMYIGMRLNLILQTVPQSKFIFIKRNPLFTAQSLLIARKRIYNDYNTWWSIKPKEFNKIKNLENTQQVVQQIYYIEKQIYKDLKLFPQENIITINYEDLQSNYNHILTKIENLFDQKVVRRKTTMEPNLNIKKDIYLDNKIIESINNEIEKFEWNDYQS